MTKAKRCTKLVRFGSSLVLVGCIVACHEDSAAPTVAAEQGAGANKETALAQQSYRMRIESTQQAIAPKVQNLAISRRLTANGWSARVEIEPNELLRNTQSHDRQVAVMEIEPDGRSTSYDVAGRRVSLTGTPSTRDHGARGGNEKPEISREGGRINPRTFDVSYMIQDRATRRSALAKLRARSGAPVRDAKGHDHFGRTTAAGGVDVIVDPELDAVIEIQSTIKGAPNSTKYEYVHVGTGLLRRKMAYVWYRTPTAGAATMTVTISNVSLNGQEVAR